MGQVTHGQLELFRLINHRKETMLYVGACTCVSSIDCYGPFGPNYFPELCNLSCYCQAMGLMSRQAFDEGEDELMG
jgi:hypothetical protein